MVSKTSRKGKKSWRKNVDIGGIEELLDELRTEETMGGTKIHQRSSAELFFTDVTGDQEVKKRLKVRQLHVDQILKPQSSAFDGIVTKKSKSSTTVVDIGYKKRPISKCILKKIETMAEHKLKNGLFPGSAANERKARLVDKQQKLQRAKGGFDLWNHKEEEPTNAFIPDLVKPLIVKRPSNDRNIQVPAVRVAHPGASYQPHPVAHMEAIQMAAKPEFVKIDQFAAIKKQLDFPAELSLIRDEELEGSSEEEEEEERVEYLKTQQPTRKTRAQRNKEAKRRETMRKEAKLKQTKKLLQQIVGVKKIKKEIEVEEAKKQERQSKKTQKRNAILGKLRFTPAPMEIQLKDEVVDVLRRLKPEGNAFKDRFCSIQERGLVEPRVPTTLKRKYRIKQIESHDYKRFK